MTPSLLLFHPTTPHPQSLISLPQIVWNCANLASILAFADRSPSSRSDPGQYIDRADFDDSKHTAVCLCPRRWQPRNKGRYHRPSCFTDTSASLQHSSSKQISFVIPSNLTVSWLINRDNPSSLRRQTRENNWPHHSRHHDCAWSDSILVFLGWLQQKHNLWGSTGSAPFIRKQNAFPCHWSNNHNVHCLYCLIPSDCNAVYHGLSCIEDTHAWCRITSK